MHTKKLELEARVKTAREELARAEQELAAWEQKAENNVYESLDDALYCIEEKLQTRAFNDCQGAHNCGDEEYRQEFIACGVRYVGILKCEYNRHDKTYYYVDNSDFTYETVGIDG